MITILNGGDLGGQEDSSDWSIGTVKTFTTDSGRVLQYRKDSDDSAVFIGYL
jgi:hypothetical protein